MTILLLMETLLPLQIVKSRRVGSSESDFD